MIALSISLDTLTTRAYETAREDEFKTTVTDHGIDEGAWFVQREGMPLQQVWTEPFGAGRRCTCGWFKITGVCSHLVSVDFHLDLLRQEVEHEERTEAARFMDWCKLERAQASGAFDGGDYLSDPFAE